jgi:hypothetical protein
MHARLPLLTASQVAAHMEGLRAPFNALHQALVAAQAGQASEVGPHLWQFVASAFMPFCCASASASVYARMCVPGACASERVKQVPTE